jgi:hypothetical protein
MGSESFFQDIFCNTCSKVSEKVFFCFAIFFFFCSFAIIVTTNKKFSSDKLQMRQLAKKQNSRKTL